MATQEIDLKVGEEEEPAGSLGSMSTLDSRRSQVITHSPALDFGSISNPQLKLKLRQQAFDPACVPTDLHPNPYLLAHSPKPR
jgi:hypothetical protein